MVNENASSIAPRWEFWQGSVWLDGTFMSYTQKEESERVTAHPEYDSFFKILKGSLFIPPPKR